MDVVIRGFDIPNESWDEMDRLNNNSDPGDYMNKKYDAVEVAGPGISRHFKFPDKEKYVEFYLTWM